MPFRTGKEAGALRDERGENRILSTFQAISITERRSPDGMSVTAVIVFGIQLPYYSQVEPWPGCAVARSGRNPTSLREPVQNCI